MDGIADRPDAPLRGNFGQLRRLEAKHPGLKVIWSFGGWTWSGGFGDAAKNPAAFAQSCYDLVEAASALVVLGSSLTVMSGFRYVRHASRLERPVVIVNQGTTRGDDYAAATLDAPLGPILTALVAALR